MREWTSPDGRLKLYNMDCMDFMRGCRDGEFALACVDPPYGIGADKKNSADKKQSKQSATRSIYYGAQKWDSAIPNSDYFESLNRVSKKQIVWGANYYGLLGGMLVWDKKVTMPTYSQCEIAWLSFQNKVDYFCFDWHGMIQGNMTEKETRIHPTQKPVALYRWLFQNYAKPGDRILDTHVGSASSFIAAWEKGFEITGCELDADYFDAAVARIEKAMQQPSLPFDTPPAKPMATAQELF